MVPWRATDDGFVTPDVIDWYGRFADGQPGRARRRGDRHPRRAVGAAAAHRPRSLRPGPARLVDAVREASGGETRLFIQLIDFLAIRRRPPRDKFFARFLDVTGRHREALARLDGDPARLAAPTSDVRARWRSPR